MIMTQRTTEKTLEWLAADRRAHRKIWAEKCLVRARSGRNLPAVAPSALAAAHMVPMSDRLDRAELLAQKTVQGLVGFADDPSDGNPFGHVYTLIGRNKIETPICDTNDALGTGYGWIVGYDWFKPHWGDDFSFASRSLNGFALLLPRANPNPNNHPSAPTSDPGFALASVEYAIHRMEKAIIWREKHTPGKVALIRALRKDLAELKETRRTFGK
jgi:hypothetical protein